MKATHIEHIGIAVKNLEEAIGLYERLLGVPCYGVESVADQGVRTAFFKLGETKVELLESTNPDGPIARFIAKRGEGIHHIALAVESLTDAMKEAEETNLERIDTDPRRGAEGLQIAFLHPKSTGGVLLELCEQPRT